MDCSAKDTDRHQDNDDDDEEEEEEEEEDVGGIHSVEDVEVEDDDDDVDGDEMKSLLPAGKNGMLRSFTKGMRTVQWNDSIGNNLTEVLEFMPSESSENDDDDPNSYLCIIM